MCAIPTPCPGIGVEFPDRSSIGSTSASRYRRCRWRHSARLDVPNRPRSFGHGLRGLVNVRRIASGPCTRSSRTRTWVTSSSGTIAGSRLPLLACCAERRVAPDYRPEALIAYSGCRERSPTLAERSPSVRSMWPRRSSTAPSDGPREGRLLCPAGPRLRFILGSVIAIITEAKSASPGIQRSRQAAARGSE